MRLLYIILSVCMLSLFADAKETNKTSLNMLSGVDQLFIENKGQIGDQHGKPNSVVKFLLLRPGLNIQLRNNGFSYDAYVVQTDNTSKSNDSLGAMATPSKELRSIEHSSTRYDFHRVDMELVGCNPSPTLERTGQSGDYLNYYTHVTADNGSEDGATYVRGYERVLYRDVWPHIDMEWFLDDAGTPEYQFIVRSGGDLDDIKIRYHGALKTYLKDGAIMIDVSHGTIREKIPRSYFRCSGEIPAIVRMVPIDETTFGYQLVGTYPDGCSGLVIDPTPERLWATYYGGSAYDFVNRVTVNSVGDVYAVGWTKSLTAIATTGAHQATLNAGADGVICKLNESGTRLWSTYYGGENNDALHDVAFTVNGGVSVVGQTWSDAGIATAGTHKSTKTYQVDSCDAYVGKFTTLGTRSWGTYFGGADIEVGARIAVSSNDDLYFIGFTRSYGGVATAGAHQTVFGGDHDGYVVKLNSTGIRQWSTYYGGTGYDYLEGIAVNQLGNIVVSGRSGSTAGIATAGAHQTVNNNSDDGVIVTFTAAGVRVWGTYMGGPGFDRITNLTLTSSNDIYLVGDTQSSTGVSTPGSYQTTYAGGQDGFIAKFNSGGVRQWSTYFGGTGAEFLQGVAVIGSGDVVFVGSTTSTSAIATTDAYQTTIGGATDFVIGRMSTSGVRSWCTYYGGTDVDKTWSSDVFHFGNPTVSNTNEIYLSGEVSSLTGIASVGSHQSVNAGGMDGAIIKLRDNTCTPPTASVRLTGTHCIGNVVSASVTVTPGVTVRWNNPKNGIVQNGALTDTSLTIRWNTSGTDTLRIKVMRANDTTCFSFASIIVTVNQLPTAVVSGAKLTCVGQVYTYRAMYYPGSTYIWRTSANGNITSGANTDAVNVVWNASGIDTLFLRETITATGCTKDTFFVVSISTRPNPVIIGPTNLCEFTRAAYRITPSNGRSYRWRASTNGSVIGSLTTDSVVVQWRSQGVDTIYVRETDNSTGCYRDTFAIVRVNALPRHAISGSASICTDSTQSYVATNATGLQLQWTIPQQATLVSGALTSSQISLRWNQVGTFSLTLRGTVASTGCSKDTTIQVTVRDMPNADVTGPSSMCLSDSKGKVYTVPAGPVGTTYTWTVLPAVRGTIVSGGASSQVRIDWQSRGTATLIVVVRGPSGCSRDSSLSIDIQDSLKPTITSSTGFAICPGDSIRLDAGSGYTSYAWFEGTTLVSNARYYVTNKAATYRVAVSNGGCSGSSTTITTTVNPQPTATVTENPVGTLRATTNAAQPRYQWYDATTGTWTVLAGQTNSTFVPNVSGSYGVEVTNGSTGCRRRSTAYQVTIGPPPTDPVITSLTPSVTICAGEQATLRVRVAGGKQPYSYSWSDGTNVLASTDTLATIAPITSINVSCIVTDADSKRDTATMSIQVNPRPTAGITENVPGLLTATPASAQSYQWYGASMVAISGATASTYSPSSSGDYYVVVMQQNCSDTSAPYTYTAPPAKNLIVSDYDFGAVPVDNLINGSGGHVGSVRVYNKTGESIELIGADVTDGQSFIVPDQWPRRMKDGDTTEIAVRFVPSELRQYNDQITVRTSTAYTGAGKLIGRGRTLSADERVTQVILRPSRTEVQPGDTLSVALMVGEERPLSAAGVSGTFVATIQWDCRVLEPLPTPGMSYDTAGTYAVATIGSGIRQANQNQLYKFRFRAKQAEVDTTTIIFSGARGFAWSDDRKAYPALVDSVVRVRICNDGGPQLIGRSIVGGIRSVVPNPARDVVNVMYTAQEESKLVVTSIEGTDVLSMSLERATAPREISFSVNTLPAGSYRISIVSLFGIHSQHIIVLP